MEPKLESKPGVLTLFSSCPDLFRASISASAAAPTEMPGTSPGMTEGAFGHDKSKSDCPDRSSIGAHGGLPQIVAPAPRPAGPDLDFGGDSDSGARAWDRHCSLYMKEI